MGDLGGGEGLVVQRRTQLQFEGERTAVRTTGVNAAPRSPTGATLRAGVRDVRAPPEWRTMCTESSESGAGPGSVAAFGLSC